MNFFVSVGSPSLPKNKKLFSWYYLLGISLRSLIEFPNSDYATIIVVVPILSSFSSLVEQISALSIFGLPSFTDLVLFPSTFKLLTDFLLFCDVGQMKMLEELENSIINFKQKVIHFINQLF